jgi:hypothetical protein
VTRTRQRIGSRSRLRRQFGGASSRERQNAVSGERRPSPGRARTSEMRDRGRSCALGKSWEWLGYWHRPGAVFGPRPVRPRRLARRDLARRECAGDRVHRPQDILRRHSADFAVAGGRDARQAQSDGRSRQRGSRRSRHSFIASMSRPSAAATALRVNPSASSSSNAAAVSIALLRKSGRRPPGLPDRPGSNGRPHPRPHPAAGRARTSLLIKEASLGCEFAIFIHAIS